MSGPRHVAVVLDEVRLLALSRAGVSTPDIARRFGVSARSASSALQRARAAEATAAQLARTGVQHGNAPPA